MLEGKKNNIHLLKKQNKTKSWQSVQAYWWKWKVKFFSAPPQCMPWAALIMTILLFSCSRQEMLSTPIRFVWVAPGWKWRKFNFLTCREEKKRIIQCCRGWSLGWMEYNQCHLKILDVLNHSYRDIWLFSTLKSWMDLYVNWMCRKPVWILSELAQFWTFYHICKLPSFLTFGRKHAWRKALSQFCLRR